MSEATKDPAIKLFGKNIPVREHAFPAETSHGFSSYNQSNDGTKASEDDCGEAARSKADNLDIQKPSAQDAPDTSKGKVVICQNPVRYGEVQNKKPEEEHAVGGEIIGDQRVFKKPDKILPCPRCNSMDTKFCYFNNYNVNQPRHFCRNCQRYWTAGGTVRNVPIGSGRRKNKQSSSHCHQVVLTPAAVPVAQNEVLKPGSQLHLSGVGVPVVSRPVEGLRDVLKFPTDSSLCQSMETVLNLKDHKGKLESTSGCTEGDAKASFPCGSSSQSTALQENQLLAKEMKQFGASNKSHGSPPTHPMQLYSGCPWPYQWNPCWNVLAGASEAGNSNPVYLTCPPLICSPNITVPVVPVANWSCIPRLPYFPYSSCASPSFSTTSSGCSGDSTPTLGKHSRDTNLEAEEKTEQSLWVPKTLRIKDPEDAAKSPIWDNLGISPKESTTKTSILKALHPGSNSTSHTPDTDQVLQANPAALSRSQSFHEST